MQRAFEDQREKNKHRAADERVAETQIGSLADDRKDEKRKG